jgi:phage terminase large subunit
MSDPKTLFISQAAQAGLPMEQTASFLKGKYTPLPWALDFHRLARECDREDGPTEIGVGGSRGPGKSFALYAQVAIDDCLRHAGLKVLYLRKIGVEGKEQFRELRDKLLLNKVPHTYKESSGVIEFPNGSRIRVGGFKDERDVDKYLGMQYHIIVIEECTTLSATKYQALRDSNRSSDRFRPRMYNSTNPGGIGHSWYRKTFVEPARKLDFTGKTRFIPATVDDNPLINKEYISNLEQNVGWRLRAYRYGDWDIAAGQYFTNFRYNIHVVEPTIYPVSWTWWGGYDHGFVHPAVFHLGAQDNEGNIYIADESVTIRGQVDRIAHDIACVLERNEIAEVYTPASQPYKRVKDHRLRAIAAGSDIFARRANDGGKSVAENFRTLGLKMKAANMDRVNGWGEILKRLGDVEGGGDSPSKVMIEPTLFISKRCERLIETLPLLEHDPARPEDVLKVDADEEGQGGDDAADSARYLAMERVRMQRAGKQYLRYAQARVADDHWLPAPYRD